MKISRPIALAYVLVLHIALGSLAMSWPVPMQFVPFHQELNTHMIRVHGSIDQQVPAGATLLFGDSLTAGLYPGAVAMDAVNYGIGGNTTADLIGRLPNYGSIAHAKRVVILIGVNDLYTRSDEEIVASVERIVGAVPEGPRIDVVGLLPTRKPEWSDRILGVNDGLQVIADNCTRCRYLDAGEALADERGDLRAEFDWGDGLHLSAAGYRVLAQQLRDDTP